MKTVNVNETEVNLQYGLEKIDGYPPSVNAEDLSLYFKNVPQFIKNRLLQYYAADYEAFGFAKPMYLQ